MRIAACTHTGCRLFFACADALPLPVSVMSHERIMPRRESQRAMPVRCPSVHVREEGMPMRDVIGYRNLIEFAAFVTVLLAVLLIVFNSLWRRIAPMTV
jgi:hypothetical protein